MKSFLTILALTATFAPTVFADSVTMMTTAIPETTLPGLPVILQLDVYNSGQDQFRLPESFSIEVTDSSANRFLVRYGRTDSVTFALPKYDANRTIPPRGHAHFQIELGDQITLGAFVSDQRTWKPDTYTVRLLFSDPSFGDAPSRRFESASTSIVVEEPRDEEAAAWRFILDATKGRGLDAHIRMLPQIGRELFPAIRLPNRYWPYVARMGTPSDEAGRLEHQVRLLAEIPADHPLYPRVQFANAELRLRRALRAAGEEEPSDEVKAGLVEAYMDLVSISATSPLDSTRADAAAVLARVKNEHAIEALILEQKLPAVE